MHNPNAQMPIIFQLCLADKSVERLFESLGMGTGVFGWNVQCESHEERFNASRYVNILFSVWPFNY